LANFTLYENGTLIISPDHKSDPLPKGTKGKKEKKYSIDSATYRKIASSAVNLWAKKKNNLTFFTLTFPFEPYEEVANNCFSKFVENLKLNYDLKNYIAVKERGEQFGRLHFHAIFDLPRIDILKINAAWCATFRNYSSPSACAVRLPKRSNGGAVIRSQKRCVKYLCKYIGKSKDRLEYSKPCVFITRDILSRPLKLTHEEVEDIKQQYYTQAYITEYVTFLNIYKDATRKEQVYFNNLQD